MTFCIMPGDPPSIGSLFLPPRFDIARRVPSPRRA
jgi:hypothetical protein